jgi:hypothetical protein
VDLGDQADGYAGFGGGQRRSLSGESRSNYKYVVLRHLR